MCAINAAITTTAVAASAREWDDMRARARVANAQTWKKKREQRARVCNACRDVTRRV